jgi:hypothetical protein
MTKESEIEENNENGGEAKKMKAASIIMAKIINARSAKAENEKPA